MQVLLTSHGSTGDIVPMIALGKALRARGHSVRFATTPFFQAPIEAAGLTFIRVPPDWGQAEFAASMRALHRVKSPLRQLRSIYRQAKPFLEETATLLRSELKNTDLLVGSYLFPSFKQLAAEAGARFATVCFCHNVIPSEDFPPAGFPRLTFLSEKLRTHWNRAAWRISDQVLDATINHELKAFSESVGLGRCQHFVLQPADCVLVAVSPVLMQAKDAQYGPVFHFTGYLRHQSEEDPALEARLDDFCQGDRIPVVTFGSVTWEGADAAMRLFLQNWPSERRLILQAGWADFGRNLALPHILRLRTVSHDQLFRHASSVLHHGGAGTTASALHAGIPQVIAPQIADQGFWAEQITRLGVGLRASPRGWPRQAPRLLRRVAEEEAFRQAAQKAARQLLAENGANQAVHTLEEFCR